MLRILYISIFLLFNFFVAWRVTRFLHCCGGKLAEKKVKILAWLFYVVMTAVVILAHFLQASGRYRFLEHVASHWMGIIFYSLFYVVVADLLRLLGRLFRIAPKAFWEDRRRVRIAGLVVLICCILTITYGFVHVTSLKTKEYSVTVQKSDTPMESMRIVLVADQHLGYNMGAEYMEVMAARINELKPDLVCIAGDVFNNNYNALDDPDRIMEAFKSIESTYGVYGCWGNHDVTEPLFSGFSVRHRSLALRDPRMDKLMEDANVIMLDDEAVLVEDAFYVVGRLDFEKAGDGTSNRKEIEELLGDLDHSKPIFVIDHEPRELDRAAEAGTDLDLSGHTHAGQIFPLTLTSKIIWENDYGVLQKGKMHSIVTSGIGVYGAPMRVATDSEVVLIEVTFE